MEPTNYVHFEEERFNLSHANEGDSSPKRIITFPSAAAPGTAVGEGRHEALHAAEAEAAGLTSLILLLIPSRAPPCGLTYLVAHMVLRWSESC